MEDLLPLLIILFVLMHSNTRNSSGGCRIKPPPKTPKPPNIPPPQAPTKKYKD